MALSLIPQKQKGKVPAFNVSRIILNYKEIMPVVYVFIFLVVAYFALIFWNNYLNTSIEDIEREQQGIFSESETPEAIELKVFARRARALKAVVDNHNLPSNFFGEFEASTHTQVVILDFDLNVNSRFVEVEGATRSFETLGEQFVIWQSASDFVRDVSLESFSKNPEGGIDFSARIDIVGGYLR